MEAALHITINRAGDPEKLGALLKAAMDVQETPTKYRVPDGYRCVECYADDGGHEGGCSIGMHAAAQKKETDRAT